MQGRDFSLRMSVVHDDEEEEEQDDGEGSEPHDVDAEEEQEDSQQHPPRLPASPSNVAGATAAAGGAAAAAGGGAAGGPKEPSAGARAREALSEGSEKLIRELGEGSEKLISALRQKEDTGALVEDHILESIDYDKVGRCAHAYDKALATARLLALGTSHSIQHAHSLRRFLSVSAPLQRVVVVLCAVLFRTRTTSTRTSWSVALLCTSASRCCCSS